MNIEHIAIWVRDLERMKAFYETYFDAQAGPRYHNPTKAFSSYFLSFGDGPRMELMHNPSIAQQVDGQRERIGLVHFAVSVGSKDKVDQLTTQLRGAGHRIHGEPRTTGDGYYESVVIDPEGNLIEITV